MYCMQFIEDNIDWLKERIAKLKGKYLIFDLPGKVDILKIYKKDRFSNLKIEVY